eukprot:CAMPEP_0185034528 /NCGR_PEP_ID=MMETSP1103-20130426/24498_1 /TAXON_ID=36769 /ORGANISM="Paraphysomonas bandaiensis, Strain Caron Lab Isolate" /LENGTH=89 /DNA_ID=CAMNT_0027571219 /DNA_START=52 /DNA_END=321 /DNA_ORIENTATION=-
MALPVSKNPIQELTLDQCKRISSQLDNLSLILPSWDVPQYLQDFEAFETDFRAMLKSPIDADVKLLAEWRQSCSSHHTMIDAIRAWKNL